MTPETFVEQLRKALPAGVRSIVLYGSAVAGDHLGKQSDYNVLIVLERLGMEELKALSMPTKAWVNEGNHPPLLFTLDGLRRSADVFPIELLDVRDARKVLFGDDVLLDVEVSDANLRTQVEHELRGKLTQLQSQFLLTEAKPKQILALMTGTVSKFLILFRAALRLYQEKVPAKKLDALRALAQQMGIDAEAFVIVLELKEGRRKPGGLDAAVLFERYMKAIDTVARAVDDLRKGTDK